MFKRFALTALLGLLVSATAAHATSITYNLTVDLSSSGLGAPTGLGTGVYAQVTLTQNGANVDVKETLANSAVYAKTGAGDALLFNIAGDPAITVTGLSSGFTFVPTGDTVPSIGAFDYAVVCSGCGNGTSPPNFSGPLMFTIANVNISSFRATGGYFFLSDIGLNGNTGNVGGNTRPSSPTPEPSSLLLMGTGVLGFAGIVRRRLQ